MKNSAIFLLSVLSFSVFGAEKVLLRNLTQLQKQEAYQYALRNCVLTSLNNGATLMVRHTHSEECKKAADDGSRVCVIDGVSQNTFPVTQETYEKHLRSGGVAPVALTMESVKMCEACNGKGKFVEKNETVSKTPLRINGMGHLVGGKTVTNKGMDTITFCKECNGTGKIKVSEVRDVDVSLL